jgi:hypothetical protein
LSAGDYTARIKARAVANTAAESPATEFPFTVENGDESAPPQDALPEPDNIEYYPASADGTGDVLVWDDVPYNDGYRLDIYDESDVRVLHYEGVYPQTSAASLPLGEYTAKLKTVGDGVTYADSSETEFEFEIETFGEFVKPSNVTVSNGFLTWDKVAGVYESVITVYNFRQETVVPAAPKFLDVNHLYLTDLEVNDGIYDIGVKLISNRYNTEYSDEERRGVQIESVLSYTASQMVNWSGTKPAGEHAAVSLVTQNGVQYAEIRPTADGWGRLASPQIAVDFDRRPIVFMSIGYVFGGYHLQIAKGDSPYMAIYDTAKLGNASADLAALTGLKGHSPAIRLRIGVNGSTSTEANDARVLYKSISLSYISEVVPPAAATLDAPANVRLNDDGTIVWDAPTNAPLTAYTVTVTQGAATVHSGDVTGCAFNAATVRNGIYGFTVYAKNTLFPELITQSAPTSEFNFQVTSAARFTPEQIDSGAGTQHTNFRPYNSGGNAVSAALDGQYALFNSTGVTSWGGLISPSAGITADMDKNPMLVIRTRYIYRGYYLKAVFGGGSEYDVVGDTAYRSDSPVDITIPLNRTKDGTPINGVKTDFRFILGVPGQNLYGEDCRMLLSGLDIVYVSEFTAPEQAVDLDSPAGIVLSKGVLSAQPVDNSLSYAFTLTDSSSAVQSFNSPAPLLDLSALGLASGVYTVTIQALGDRSGEGGASLYFNDSLVVTKHFTYSVTASISITSFANSGITAANCVNRMGSDASNYTVDESLQFTQSGTGWGIFSIPVQMGGKAFTPDSSVTFTFGSVTPGATFASRYFNASSGDSRLTPYNDVSVTENGTFTMNSADIINRVESAHNEAYAGNDKVNGAPLATLDKAAVVDGVFYLGIGMGGGSATRTLEIKSIVLAGLEEYVLSD